ncbi:hypothetical protein J4Q44_G00011890 [Coregonus suidteri]|uniref:PCI domain-containing protein n=1 Tax=Coregonus suidteri TaxID=861788 RepID=A0AAN8R8G6_9TELE
MQRRVRVRTVPSSWTACASSSTLRTVRTASAHVPSCATSTTTRCTRAGIKPRDLMLMSHLQDNIQHADPPVQSEQDAEESEGEDSAFIMDRLCKFIYAKDRTDRIRTCAILCHIYHHALHSRWYQARDLMLMSHLQDNIQHADPPVQILYNRTMVQLGICAFRQGMIKDAHNALLDIQSSGRAKELLGQGLLMRNMQERNAEQEKIEKRRQVPFHMHINLELLECVYLVSAMLLEIPYMAAHEFDARRRMISKQFHHQLRVGERQPLLGPPESMREHVVAASKSMKMGDWRTCHSFIINEKMNSKVWDLFPETQCVREMLVRKIQEESLRTYLLTYSSVYDSISMETLKEMFELELPMVHSIISKMIINEELMASLDQPTQTVVMHRTEPTSLQNMALQLAEKLGGLVENNERVFDLKQGVYGGYFNRDQKGGYQQKQGGYNRDQRGSYQQKQGVTTETVREAATNRSKEVTTETEAVTNKGKAVTTETEAVTNRGKAVTTEMETEAVVATRGRTGGATREAGATRVVAVAATRVVAVAATRVVAVVAGAATRVVAVVDTGEATRGATRTRTGETTEPEEEPLEPRSTCERLGLRQFTLPNDLHIVEHVQHVLLSKEQLLSRYDDVFNRPVESVPGEVHF